MTHLNRKRVFIFISILCIIITIEIICLIIVQITGLNESPNQRNWKSIFQQSHLYPDINTDLLYSEQKKVYQNVTFDFFKFYQPLANFKGYYMTTDQRGFRTTIQYPKTRFQQEKIVAFFGGSTVWGTGAAGDENTIPSLFGKFLNEGKTTTNYHVLNYGVGGYNNSQVLILFLEEIEQKKIDYAIFFYFIAEAISGYRDLKENHRGGTFLQPNVGVGYHAMVDYLRAQPSSQGKVIQASLKLLEITKKVNFIKILSYFIHRIKQSSTVTGNLKEDTLHFSLSQEEMSQVYRVIHLYEQHKKIIKSLSDKFHFKAFFIFEPSIYTKRYLSPYEKQSPFLIHSKETLFQKKIFELARKKFSNDPYVIDLSNCVDTSETVFLDDHHTEKKGNQIIAQALVDAFKARILKDE